MPPHHTSLTHCQEFDSLVRDALDQILGSNIGDIPWLQAQLPVSMGGLGLRSKASHAFAAFIASFFDAETLSKKFLQQ